MPLAANGSLESDAAMLLATERGGTERDDAAMLLGTTAEGPNAAMLHSDEGDAQRTESAVGSRVDDQPRRQSVRLLRTCTGDETAGTAIEIRETETLAQIHQHAKALLASGNRTITADLPLVANFVNGWHKLGKTSASRILDDIRRKPRWNLGTKVEILERFAAKSVPLLHKTMMLLELKEGICTILEEWMKETPPLSPKMLQFPSCWPSGDPDQWAPVLIREWAQRLLYDRAAGKIAIPERTRAAIQRYCELPIDYRTGQHAPDQPAPPAIPPTRPKPSQATAQAKQSGGNRTLSSGNTPSFTERTATWYDTARRTLRFKGGVSGGVHLDATLPNLRALLDAEPKTDLSGLRGIAADRRRQLDKEKVERHFEAGGQRAEAAYYAKVLRELYGEIVGLRDVRIDGKPTGEIKPKRINALGFPAGSSPQETRNAVVL